VETGTAAVAAGESGTVVAGEPDIGVAAKAHTVFAVAAEEEGMKESACRAAAWVRQQLGAEEGSSWPGSWLGELGMRIGSV
jgi:hypothetical protein